MLGKIVRLQLGRIAQARATSNHEHPVRRTATTWSKLVVSRCTEVESGGRMIDAILTNTVLPRISREYLKRLSDGRTLKAVRLGVKDGEFEYGFD